MEILRVPGQLLYLLEQKSAIYGPDLICKELDSSLWRPDLASGGGGSVTCEVVCVHHPLKGAAFSNCLLPPQPSLLGTEVCSFTSHCSLLICTAGLTVLHWCSPGTLATLSKWRLRLEGWGISALRTEKGGLGCCRGERLVHHPWLVHKCQPTILKGC